MDEMGMEEMREHSMPMMRHGVSGAFPGQRAGMSQREVQAAKQAATAEALRRRAPTPMPAIGVRG